MKYLVYEKATCKDNPILTNTVLIGAFREELDANIFASLKAERAAPRDSSSSDLVISYFVETDGSSFEGHD